MEELMVRIEFHRDSNRAVAMIGDEQVGECTFNDSGSVWTIDHTFVEPQYGGQGIARRLVDSIVDDAVKAGAKLAATCSYACKVFKDEKYKAALA